MTDKTAPLSDERLEEIRCKESRNLAKLFDSTVTELLDEIDRLHTELDGAKKLADYYHEDRDAAVGFWEDSRAEVNRLEDALKAAKSTTFENNEGGNVAAHIQAETVNDLRLN
jgi:uncharacterized coiled-coil DUF342 family protein